MEPLDDAWVQALVDGSADAPARPWLHARVGLCVDGGERRVLEILDGRVVGTTGGEAQVELPLTAAQLAALVAGEGSLARDYMRGDVKPVGSSGALAVAVEVLDDERVWRGLQG